MCASTGELELDFGRRRDLLTLQLGDRFRDHLHVQVVADRGDVTGLVVAEEIAGSTDLKVAHRDLEARTELGVLADRAKAFVRLLGEHPVVG